METSPPNRPTPASHTGADGAPSQGLPRWAPCPGRGPRPACSGASSGRGCPSPLGCSLENMCASGQVAEPRQPWSLICKHAHTLSRGLACPVDLSSAWQSRVQAAFHPIRQQPQNRSLASLWHQEGRGGDRGAGLGRVTFSRVARISGKQKLPLGSPSWGSSKCSRSHTLGPALLGAGWGLPFYDGGALWGGRREEKVAPMCSVGAGPPGCA